MPGADHRERVGERVHAAVGLVGRALDRDSGGHRLLPLYYRPHSGLSLLQVRPLILG